MKKAEEYLQTELDKINKGNTSQLQFCYEAIFKAIKQSQIDIAKDAWQSALTASEHDAKYCKYHGLPATVEEYLKMKGLENESNKEL